MKKISIIFILLASVLFQAVKAEPIDSTTARQLALNFYRQKTTTSIGQREAPQIVKREQAQVSITGTRHTASRDCYYVVNFENGFVIIAADDRVEPILGYSTTSTFNPQNVPDNVAAWLEGYRQEIADVISNNRSASTEISQRWYNLKHNINEGSRSTVGPLLTTTWNQGTYYNNYCPSDAGGRALTGCVATAIAQIIRYWEHPAKGVGSHTYTCSRYGTLSADFNTNYDYSLMPNQLNSSSSAAQIDAVAKLMYHVGVSVEMEYGPTESGSDPVYALTTMHDFFAYDSEIRQIYPELYANSAAYIAALKEELNNSRPILYKGEGTGAHAFVCDGYNGDQFHINWGWGGYLDGYFYISALNPGSNNFSSYQAAIIGISAAESDIWCSANSLNLSAPIGESSEVLPVEIRGIKLTNSINITVSGNFLIGNSPSTLGTSTSLPAEGGTLYVQYVPTISSNPTNDQGELYLYSGSTYKSWNIFGSTYRTICNSPTNLSATKYPSYIKLNWTAPIQNTSSEIILSWDSTVYTRYRSNYNSTYCMLQRYEVADLSGYDQYYLDAISFIPRTGLKSCHIVAYQGGSYTGSTFNPGEQVVNQEIPISTLSLNTWNRLKINNPIIIDNSKELWFGVVASVDTGFIINVGANSNITNKGGIFGLYSGPYSEGTSFYLYNYGGNIALKANLKKISGHLMKYELYKNDTYSCDISSSAISYNDASIPNQPCRYELYAVWDNYCSGKNSVMYYPSTPCLTSVTTNAVTQTSNTTATCGGNVIHAGNQSITAKGVCWSTSHNPTISSYLGKTNEGSGDGVYTSTLTGLNPGQTYYVRAYATNGSGTNYGEEQSVTLYYVVPKTSTETYTITDNTVMVYDHAGPNANFDKNCNGILTLNTGSTNQRFEITGGYQLTNYYSGSEFLDNLYIYDGNSTSGTLLQKCTRTGSITTPISSSSNYITIKFTSSNTSYSANVNPGFWLQVKKVSTTNIPTVTTNNVTNIAATSATCGGNVTDAGGSSVTSRGICWSTSQNPTTSNNKLSSGSGTGSFTKNITDLTPNTTYYVRAYATNSAGTAYGAQKGFTTPCNNVTINISGTTTINYGGSTILTASGASSYVWKQGNTTIGTNNSITVNPASTTTYTVIGTNSYGCTGTANVTVTVNNAPSTVPTVTTNAVVQTDNTSATCGGNVTHDGNLTVTARGVCWSNSHNPTIADSHSSDGIGTGTFSSTMTGLTPGITYYVRAYATNSQGTGYGEEKTISLYLVVPQSGEETFNMTSDSVIVYDHGGPNSNYGSYCMGTLIINAGSGYSLSITGIYDIESDYWDYLSITEYDPPFNVIANLSGNGNITTPIVTSQNSIILLFESDDNYEYSGFRLVIRRIGSATTPTVTTNNVSNIGTNSATCGGNVTSNGGATVTARGVCWSTSQNPTVSGSHTNDGSGTGSFSSNITGLTPNTTYYVRAYATNSAGTGYGEQKTFKSNCNTVTVSVTGTTTINYGGSTTLSASGASSYVWKRGSTTIGESYSVTVSPTVTTTYTVTGTNSYGCTGTSNVTVTVNSLAPVVTTANVTGITENSATCGGNVTSDNGSPVTARGVCWSTSQNPTVSGSHTNDGSGTGSFSSSMTGLTPNTTYYVRAYATNSAGTAYGEQKTFKTNCNTVTVNITGTTTINYGGSTTLSASGASSYVWKRGSTTIGESYSVTVSPTVTTTYTVIGTNSYGCTGTSNVTVTVNSLAPVVTTANVTGITENNATCGGNVTSDNGSPVTARGVCWSSSQNPTVSGSHTNDGSGTGSFTSSITGLTPNTTYYVRAYATNSAGTAYGEQKTFKTNCNTVTVNITGTTTINYGGSTTLSASGASSYVWKRGSTTIGESYSVTVSPTVTTTYTVIGTNSYGCTGTSNVTVTVNSLAPVVTTNNVTGITENNATCGGNVTSDGGAAVTARGVCWSTSQNPTISGSHTNDGSGTGSFNSSITGLNPNTTYYVRAYATNSVGTSYGEQKSFTTPCNTVNISIYATTTVVDGNTSIDFGQSTTLTASGADSYVWKEGANVIDGNGGNNASITVSPTVTTTYTVTGTNSYGCTGTGNVTVTVNSLAPVVTTANVSNIGTNSVICGGNVTSDNGSPVTARGVCWNTSQNPTVSGSHTTDGSGTGSFSSNITGLTPNTTYYVRAYATNNVGTSYGEQKTIKTLCNVINLTVTGNTIINHGQSTTLTAHGASSYEWSLYNWNTNNWDYCGSTASINVNPTTMTIYAVTGTNSYGCSASSITSVTVNNLAPTVNTSAISNITETTAICGGTVSSDGGTSIIDCGICWGISHNPTIDGNHTTDGNGIGNFTSNITGLIPNTTYYVRAYATNSVGTSYGNELSFTTPCSIVNVSISGNTTILYGQSASLYASGANSYSWNTGSTNASITVTPTTTTSYSVTGTDMHGCTGSASFTVTVNNILPNITTQVVSGITESTASSGGNITSDGGATVTARGVCWSTSQNPTTNDSHTSDGYGTGSFTSNITGLTPNTTYYVRAYATNNVGTVYGEQKTWTSLCDVFDLSISGNTSIDYGQSTTITVSGANSYVWKNGNTTVSTNDSITINPTSTTTYIVTGTNQYGCTATISVTVSVNPIVPTITTNDVDGITETTATCGGIIHSDGGATIFARGVCWSTSQNPTTNDNHTTNGYGTGSFTSNITGLTPNTTYYVRAYATNNAGIAYGEQKTWTSLCDVIELSISGNTSINYGESTSLTVTGADNYQWSDDSGNISNEASITINPTATTTYTVTGINQYGCTGTTNVTVTVNFLVPSISTDEISDITETTAICGGNVTFDGGATVTARGVCWSTTQNPTTNDSHTIDGSGTGRFTSSITELTPHTTYYVRAYATNSIGTGYGDEMIFHTGCHLTSSENLIACDSYTWNDSLYMQSGDYTQTFITEDGCDSTVTLHLTISHSAHTEDYLSINESELPYTYADTTFEQGTAENSVFDIHFSTVNGCDSVVTLHLTIHTVGINNHNSTSNYQISAYPNPTQQIVNVAVDNKMISISNVVIYDVTGRKIKTTEWTTTNSTRQIDLEEFVPGLYFIELYNERHSLGIIKIVKQ